MDGFKLIEQTLVERNIDTNQHIWYELAMSNTEYGPGWHGIIISMISKIEEIYKKNNVDISEFKIAQIKEKNGRLRVYHTSSLKEVKSLIDHTRLNQRRPVRSAVRQEVFAGMEIGCKHFVISALQRMVMKK